MKKITLFLFVMLVALQTISAKKDKTDPRDLKIDSLTKAADTLSKQVAILNLKIDTMSQDMMRYSGLYNTIKTKVLKRDFDPEKFSQIIDSLRAGRDSSETGYSLFVTTLKDSIAILKKENETLSAMLRGLSDDEATRNRLVYELKQLKELLDSKILSPTEFDLMKKRLLQQWK